MRPAPRRTLRLALPLALVASAIVASATVAPAAGAQSNGSRLPLKRAATPTTPEITTADLMSRVYVFSDDSMNGRLTGSTHAVKGAEMIAAELQRLGVTPAGENGSYFQEVPLGRQALDSTSTIRVGPKVLHAGTDFIAFTAMQGPAVEGRMEVVYGGVAYDTTNVLPADAIRGKILVLRQGQATPALQATAAFRSYLAAINGAAAIGFVSGPVIAQNFAQFAFSGSTQLMPAGGAPPAPANLLLTQSAAETLIGAPFATAQKGATTSVDAAVRFRFERRPGRNVVATIPGSDPALRGQYVALGAHLDAVGFRTARVDHDSVRAMGVVARPQGQESEARPTTSEETQRFVSLRDSLRATHGPMRPDSINNGADDDASGSMALLEMAEAWMAAPTKPRRSILLVWHTGEEQGMLGSRWYTDNFTVPRDSVVAQLNIDMIGRGASDDVTGASKEGTMLRGGEGYLQLLGSRRLSTELGDLVETVNRDTNAGLRFDYSLDADGHPQNIYCRSDHYMYARYGIPIVFFTTGGHRDYHLVTDEAQYLDYEHYAKVTRFIKDVADRVAGLDHRVVVDKPKPDPRGACRQ